jgi:CHAT domain-containing protein
VAVALGIALFTIGSAAAQPNAAARVLANNRQVEKLFAQGEYVQALALSEATLQLAHETLGERHIDAIVAINNQSVMLQALGRVAEALPYSERAMRQGVAALGEEHTEVATWINNHAAQLMALGRTDEALPHLERALGIARRVLGEKDRETLLIVNNIAYAMLALGRPAQALPYAERALAGFQEVHGERHPDAIVAMVNRASVLQALHRVEEAVPLFQRALTLGRQVFGERHPRMMTILNNLGGMMETLNRPAQALDFYERSLALRSAALGDRHPETLNTLTNYARLLHEHGAPERALPLLRRVLEGAEAQREDAARDGVDSQRGLFAARVPAYHLYLLALRGAGDVHEALAVLERTKARTLLDQMTLRTATQSAGLPPAVRDRLLALTRRIGELDARIAGAARDQDREALKAARGEASRELGALRRELQAGYARFRELTDVRIAGTADARELLPPDAVFVNFVVMHGRDIAAIVLGHEAPLWVDIAAMPELAENADALLAWHGSAEGGDLFDEAGRRLRIAHWREGGRPRWRVLAPGAPPCNPPAVNIGCVPTGTAFVSSDAERRALLAYLGETLLAPLRAHLAGRRQVILSPDGPLALLPWDALPLDGEPLIMRHEVSQVQSLSVLKLLRERQREYTRTPWPQALLAMGNAEYEAPMARAATSGIARGARMSLTAHPARGVDAGAWLRSLSWGNLPGTQVEMERASRLFSGASRVISGRASNETTLRTLSASGELSGYRYLLFAAHGLFDPEYPALSSLVLTPEGAEPERDGYVTVNEWPALRLRSELTILSACNSGRGELAGGEGLMGLAYALYVAGNTNVVATLWPVADNETADFVASFLARVRAGESHLRAITLTKREFLTHANTRRRNPYFWAPFVLYGM